MTKADELGETRGPLTRFFALVSRPVLAELVRIAWRRPAALRHTGSAADICRAVLEERWNGRYLSAGAAHLDQLWLRDLGWCARDLVALGHGDRVRSSVEALLAAFERAGRVTTTVLGGTDAVDFFSYGVDSLPWLLHLLSLLDARDLALAHRDLIVRETRRYHARIVDPDTGAVWRDRRFSEPKDVVDCRGTCVANTFLAWLASLTARFDLPWSGPAAEECSRSLVASFWNGRHFVNDLDSRTLSADANVWPYALGVVDDGEKLASSLVALREAGLASPFPLKYHARGAPGPLELTSRIFLPRYQTDAIWTFLGCLYVRLLAKVDRDRARGPLAAMGRAIERAGTFIETFEPDGSAPLAGRFGVGSARGMLWAAMYLGLERELGGPGLG